VIKLLYSQEPPSYLYGLIREGEGENLDFKFAINDSRKIAISLSAFANTSGGKLLIGVKDNGRIAGVRSDEEFHMIEAAAEMYTQPMPDITVYEHEIEGKTVLEAHIAQSVSKGIMAKNAEGLLKAYIRIDDENHLASPVHLALWQLQSDNTSKKIVYTDKLQTAFQIIKSKGNITLNQFTKELKTPRWECIRILALLLHWDLLSWQLSDSGYLYFLKKED